MENDKRENLDAALTYCEPDDNYQEFRLGPYVSEPSEREYDEDAKRKGSPPIGPRNPSIEVSQDEYDSPSWMDLDAASMYCNLGRDSETRSITWMPTVHVREFDADTRIM